MGYYVLLTLLLLIAMLLFQLTSPSPISTGTVTRRFSVPMVAWRGLLLALKSFAIIPMGTVDFHHTWFPPSGLNDFGSILTALSNVVDDISCILVTLASFYDLPGVTFYPTVSLVIVILDLMLLILNLKTTKFLYPCLVTITWLSGDEGVKPPSLVIPMRLTLSCMTRGCRSSWLIHLR